MKRKRSSEVDNTSNKNPRKDIASDVFDDESLSNCFCNVNNLANAIGYFTGKVDMVWSHVPDKLMWNLVASCCISDSKHKISVSLEGDWVKHLKESEWGSVAIMDDLRLSLDGVSSVQFKSPNATAKLIYREGIIFRRIRKEEPYFMNTWQSQRSETVDREDDWFATPGIPFPNRVSDLARRMSGGRPNVVPPEGADMKTEVDEKTLSESSASFAPHNGRRDETRSCLPKKESLPSVESGIKHESSIAPTSTQVKPDIQEYAALKTQTTALQKHQAPPVMSRVEMKKERKRKRAAKLAAAVSVTSTTEQPLVQNSPQNAAAGSTIAGSSFYNGSATGPAVIDLGRIGAAKIDENTSEGWLAQLHYSQPQYTYTTLKEVLKLKSGNSFNVIGIVKGRRTPYKSRNGDWSTTIHLQDPTSFEDPNYPPTDFSIVFFQKNFEEWLPQACVEDILILRNIKVQDLNGFSGIGYKDRMQWAAFSIAKECLLQPDMGPAPESGELVVGGFRFSPFLKGLEPEERYCKRLAKWWKERNSLSSESTGQVYQLTDYTSRRPREHRLFCDAGPEVEPGGYFDCTFEVLNGFESENGVFTLYVTDYTKNTQAASCQAPWCPIGLNEYVLLFNLWEEAAARGRNFKPKTYWAVRNARMVRSSNGFVEGKLVQTKFSQVDCDNDYPPLRALLERKKIWEKENAQNLPSFPHKLFKDVRVKEFFNCTVELLHTVNKGPDRVHIFVTDYTEHPELLHPRKEEWSQGLEGCVVCVQLRDNQARSANSLQGNDGKFFTIRNLRLMSTGDGRGLQGELGGYDLLLNLLQNDSPNKDLQELRKRKEEWKYKKERKLCGQAGKPQAQVVPSANLKIGQLEATTKDCLKARIIARVIDHYPRSPRDWIRFWCCQCKQRIPKGNIACHDCQDTDHEFVRPRFELALLVEDKMGDKIEVALRNESNLLQGINICNNTLNPSISDELSKRLQPLLGDPNGKEGVTGGQNRNSAFSPFIIGRFEVPNLGLIRLLIDIEN